MHLTTYIRNAQNIPIRNDIRIAYIIPYSINTRNPNIIKRADSLFQILFFRSLTCLSNFHRRSEKNHSYMTIKIFMSNVSVKVKSKISNPAEEKTSLALSQNETKIGEAKKEKPFPGEGFLSLFQCFSNRRVISKTPKSSVADRHDSRVRSIRRKAGARNTRDKSRERDLKGMRGGD